MLRPTMSVGAGSCDIAGFTNGHIQPAVDRVALLGGGEVRLSAGTFEMADSLHMRTGVSVLGQGQATVLRKAAMKQAAVVGALGFGHRDVIVSEPNVFSIGDGVLLSDDDANGFYQTVSTRVGRDGDVWRCSRAHAHDYRQCAGGMVRTLFAVVSAVDVDDARVSDLTIDGNAEENELLNGCRGGGVFAHRAERFEAEQVTVRNFNGEGFSFQQCDDLTLTDCTAEGCSGNGFHPGSGSRRFHLSQCVARRCGACGLFYCLAVRDGVVQQCTFEENASHGVSIGGRDTGHMNRRLVIRNNGGAGLYLRAGDRALAAHDNTVEGCVFEHNARDHGQAELVLQGQTRGVRVIGNRIRRRPEAAALLVLPEMGEFVFEGNTIEPDGQGAVVNRRAGRQRTGGV